MVPGCVRIEIDANGLLEVGDGTVKIALATPSIATIDERVHEFRIDLERLIEVGDGPIEAVLLVPHQAALVVGSGIREPHSDRTIKVDEGAVEIAISSPQDPTIAKQGRVVGINTDRGLVICERAILVTSLMQRLNVTVLDGRSPVYGRDDRACRNVRRRWWARRLLPV